MDDDRRAPLIRESELARVRVEGWGVGAESTWALGGGGGGRGGIRERAYSRSR